MNRNNIWIHICIASVIISTAAILGQINRWETSLRTVNTRTVINKPAKNVAVQRLYDDSAHEVLVKFRPHVTAQQISDLTSKMNDAVEDKVEAVKGLTAIDDLDGLDAESVAGQYRKMSDVVEYAEVNNKILPEQDQYAGQKDISNYADLQRNSKVKPIAMSAPNDPQFGDQWGLSNTGQEGGKANADISALKAWDKTKGSDKIVVAVLDTGIDYTHQDLAANMWFRPDNVPQYTDAQLGTFDDEHGFDAADNASDPMDDNGHGTHCAGIIGAEGDNDEGIAGINWHVQIMPLKFLGKGGFGTTKDAIESINYAIDRKQHGVNIRVINASWGSTANSKALEDVIRAAGEQGILFVAAAGNNGTNNDKNPHYPSNYDLPNVISVAATDRSDRLTSFSNFGLKAVHLAAPGKDITSTWIGGLYRDASGTSMAAPQVAGVAALILANEPNLTVEQLKARLLKSVDKLDSLSGKVASGGRLNAAKALGE